MVALGFIVGAYLLGSIAFAVIVSKAFGLADPRSYGSGNPGATNVLRSGNKAAAALTLFGDGLKGWLAVWLAQVYGPQFGLGDGVFAWVGFAVFFGHLYPVFFRFKGGKGVATAAGVLLAFDWPLGLVTLGSWIFVAALFRYSSLAALVAAMVAPAAAVALRMDTAIAFAIVAMSALLVWRHRANIGKLLAGKESRLGAKKA